MTPLKPSEAAQLIRDELEELRRNATYPLDNSSELDDARAWLDAQCAPAPSEGEREQFEAWFTKWKGWPMYRDKTSGEYTISVTECYWHVWQAARRSGASGTADEGRAEKAERRLANFIACIPPKVEGYKLTDAIAAKSLFALQDLVERTLKADAALEGKT